MLTVYLDTLLFVNLFIDYFILQGVRRLLHIQTKHSRILLGAFIAALSTLAVFLPIYTTFFSIIYKPLVAILVTITAFGFTSFRKTLVRAGAFFGISMLLCGLVLAIELIYDAKGVAVYNNVVYFDISPVVLITGTIAVYLALCIYQKIVSKHKLRCSIRRISLVTDSEERISFESAVDTGCNLKEPFSGEAVILAEKELFSNIKLPADKMRVIPFATVSGDSFVMGFKPKEITIDGKPLDGGCYVGICDNKLKGEIRSIMGTELAEASI